MDIVEPDTQVDNGDTITYEFTVRNTGDVTLTNVTVTDTIGGVEISGGPIPTLGVGDSDSTTFTGTYTLTQDDVDAGTFTNTATATGEYPGEGNKVTDEDDDTQEWDEASSIEVEKSVVGDPVKISAGIWDVTYEIEVTNNGNVTLDNLQVTDDLSAVFADPTVLVEVVEISSDDFSVNPSFDGIAGTGDINLLEDGVNSLEVEASGTITIVVRVIPANSGPFVNTAATTADTPNDDQVSAVSDPVPVDFGPNLFDPPFGLKQLNESGLPVLKWTMIWINDSNIVAINTVAYDEIPKGTTFVDNGISSGYDLPAPPLPDDSTNTGVVCDAGGSTSTTTTYCYYEGPTTEYPRGRIIWQGTLGPDLGATSPANAEK